MHETILEHEIRVGSDRQFGFVFAAFFFILGSYPALKAEPNVGCLAISGLFLLVTLAYPRALHPLNVLWHRFGLLLAKFTQPVILGALFFLVLTPIGLIAAWVRGDALNRKFPTTKPTLWKQRKTPFKADNFKEQF
ncbi:MAG: hypothetical protein R3B54_16595 [Bdellovibrionota bacterium]